MRFQNKIRGCDDRIVSIHQPYVRTIFEASKTSRLSLSVSLMADGIVNVDHLRWAALIKIKIPPVEAYYQRYGVYPKGRPKKMTKENREELKQKKPGDECITVNVFRLS